MLLCVFNCKFVGVDLCAAVSRCVMRFMQGQTGRGQSQHTFMFQLREEEDEGGGTFTSNRIVGVNGVLAVFPSRFQSSVTEAI